MDSDHLGASRLRQIVERIPWWLSYILGALGTLQIALLGLTRDATIAVIMLSIFSLGWIAMCVFWVKLANSSIRHHSDLAEEYEHLFDYIAGANEIFRQALDALSTYDRERAEELAYDLHALATKSLYHSYWRREMNEREGARGD